jgi:CRISPR-associated protein Cmr3
VSEKSQERELNIWVIEPREPLIFRDGRPFSNRPGVVAQSLPFPFPATTTGGVRTQAGLDDRGIFAFTSNEQLETLKKLRVRGPLLVQILPQDERKGQGQEEQSEALDWFVPAPADALLLKPEEKGASPAPAGTLLPKPDEKGASKVKARVKRLLPVQIGEALTDLAFYCAEKEMKPALQLVGMQTWVSGKPIEKPPRYWRWDVFQKWLLSPEDKEIEAWSDLGIMGPQQEQRVHVSMDGEKHQGKEGALFATRAMEFVVRNDEEELQEAHPLGLAMIVEKDAQPVPREGFAAFGGERRIVHWRKYQSSALTCPSALTANIAVNEQGVWPCRMILLTPACFDKGFYPTAIQEEQDGVKPTLKAIALQRPDVISGWDFVRGKPKRTRRLVPAGTVFFLELKGEQEAIRNWVEHHWLQCVSDERQDRTDGFGLAVIGTWNGEPQEMQLGAEA